MRHWRLLIVVAAVAMLATPTLVGAQSLLFDYIGFDYESPDPTPGTFGETGSGYVCLGTVPGLFAPLVADTANYEYTYVLSGLSPIGHVFVSTYEVVDYSDGVLSLYEDAKSGGTIAAYGTAPPNGTAPSTFSDGTMILTGTVTNFQFVFNTLTGSGSYEGVFTITGGSQLGNFPTNQRVGYTFAGATMNGLYIPDGYTHDIDGQNLLGLPVRTRAASWGQVKAVFR